MKDKLLDIILSKSDLVLDGITGIPFSDKLGEDLTWYIDKVKTLSSRVSHLPWTLENSDVYWGSFIPRFLYTGPDNLHYVITDPNDGISRSLVFPFDFSRTALHWCPEYLDWSISDLPGEVLVHGLTLKCALLKLLYGKTGEIMEAWKDILEN